MCGVCVICLCRVQRHYIIFGLCETQVCSYTTPSYRIVVGIRFEKAPFDWEKFLGGHKPNTSFLHTTSKIFINNKMKNKKCQPVNEVLGLYTYTLQRKGIWQRIGWPVGRQLGLGARFVRSFTLKTPYPFWALSPPMLKKTTIKTYRFTSTHSLDQKKNINSF